MDKYISTLKESGIFNEIDLQLAQFIGRTDNSKIILFTSALLSRKLLDGHICLPLRDLAGKTLTIDDLDFDDVPPFEKWLEALQNSPAVGTPREFKPLILDNGRVYLQKYWFYEKKIADRLGRMAAVSYEFDKEKEQTVKEDFRKLFRYREDKDRDKISDDEKPNWQKTAAIMALSRKFCIISGGPGTGKTTTLAKVLCILLKDKPKLKIGLAAPTGKAAARMNESIIKAAGELDFEKKVLDTLTSSKAITLHRLLGPIANSVNFRHDKDNPLHFDIVIIDEASMVDIAMMTRLLDALKEDTRLILLGDKNQLSSVEAGSVLGDICSLATENRFSSEFLQRCNRIMATAEEALDLQLNKAEKDASVFSDCIVQFARSYRFKSWEGVGKLSRYINSNDDNKERTFEIMEDELSKEHVCFSPLPALKKKISETFKQKIVAGYSSYIAAASPEEALREFDNFRILCALRKGEYGVGNINRVAEEILKENIQGFYPSRTSYHNRPVMITRNDAAINLFNGDVGIIRKKGREGLKAYFPPAEEGGSAREISLNLLPEHETVFAMTVHKSQGSEFKRILMITPDRTTPVLTRELVYTGITRTREFVEIMGHRDLFLQAVNSKTERYSGLSDRLKQLLIHNS